MTKRTRLVLGIAGVLVVFFGVLMLTYWDTYQIIPGGPKLPQLPDLIVESIEFKGSEGTSSPCTGLHTATFNVTVTIRNAGITTADLPFGKSWVVIWSVYGGTAPPFKGWITAPPAQLAPGQTAALTEKVAAIAAVAPDKSKSWVTFEIVVDPDHVIPATRPTTSGRSKPFMGASCAHHLSERPGSSLDAARAKTERAGQSRRRRCHEFVVSTTVALCWPSQPHWQF